ncbi:hypothetical protein AYJ66_17490 [Dietzia cinnamea]|nr:hypothetical protein AYJ66_17490 [Dietzia cinnamea]
MIKFIFNFIHFSQVSIIISNKTDPEILLIDRQRNDDLAFLRFFGIVLQGSMIADQQRRIIFLIFWVIRIFWHHLDRQLLHIQDIGFGLCTPLTRQLEYE